MGDKLCVNRGIYYMGCDYVMFVFDQCTLVLDWGLISSFCVFGFCKGFYFGWDFHIGVLLELCLVAKKLLKIKKKILKIKDYFLIHFIYLSISINFSSYFFVFKMAFFFLNEMLTWLSTINYLILHYFVCHMCASNAHC